MHQHHDAHAHRNLSQPEEPLDAANQSLSDALMASFGILKMIMVILFVLYLVSNVRGISSHEQALKLRLGALQPDVQEAGLVWALPFPVEEILRLPTRKSNDLTVTSHTFHRRANEIGKSLSFISRSPHEELHPTLDGALLTADAGLVHVQWKVTYKIHNVKLYVTRIAGVQVEAAESLIRSLVETIGIQVASELTAEEIIRTRLDYVQVEMKRRINERLRALESGINVETVEMFEPTPPIQVRASFDRTQQAENAKEKRIREAWQERTKLLSEAAGAGYRQLVDALDAVDAEDSPHNRAELERSLRAAEGGAGEMLKDASSYHSVVVGKIKIDLAEYRTLIPEFERNPAMLVERLWEETRAAIFNNPGVTKLFRPRGLREFRILIPLDPKEQSDREEQRVRKKKFDIKSVVPEHWDRVDTDFE